MSHDPSSHGGPGGPSRTTERKAHIKRLRRRAIAVCLVCFALFWGVITVRMAVGDDPVFGGAGSGSPTVSSRVPPVSESASGTATESSREGAAVEELFAEAEAESRPSESESEVEEARIESEEAQIQPEPIQTGQS